MLASTVAKNLSLDACYGDNKAAGWPATIYLALFVGDPSASGTELTSTGGYARVAVTNNGPASSGTWAAAASGSKSNAAAISFANSSGAFSGTATYFCFFDALTSGNKLDGGALSTSVTVTLANSVVRFTAGQITLTAT